MLHGEAVLLKEGISGIRTAGDIFSVLPYENHSLTSSMPVSLISMCIKKQLADLPITRYTEIISAAVNGMKGRGLDALYAARIIDEAKAAYSAYAEKAYDEDDTILISERRSIEKYPENTEDLNESSRIVFMSKYHFIRRFRRVSGLTPHKFRIQNRVRKAQRHLSEGTAISEAALMSGFYDQSHFDRYFKKIVGISPKDYIDSLRNFLQE